jgi:hypothetical protein
MIDWRQYFTVSPEHNVYAKDAKGVASSLAKGPSAYFADNSGCSQEMPSLDVVLRGRAVELWSDARGERFWLVADEEDATKLAEPRGTVYTASEARRVVQIGDSAIVREIHEWKRRFDGRVREVQMREARRGTRAAAASDGGEGHS